MQSYNELDIIYSSDDLNISFHKLDSLEGCPEHITGGFYCNYNRLETLIGGPQRVDGDYHCDGNKLTDLNGCASHISRGLICDSNNGITSLVGIHKIIKSCNNITFSCHRITEGGIGLLLIDNLVSLHSYTEPFNIIQKYLGNRTKGMMECRSELISKGFPEYAKL